MILKTNYKLIIFISLAFSLIVGSGVYGYGVDFYEAYHQPNLNWGAWTDRLGWRISTFTIFNKHIGVYLVSFVLAFSFGILLNFFFEYKEKKSTFLFIFIMIIALHTWPIIMSTSNAMRQGIAMSLIFLSLSYLLKKKNFKSFIFIFISIFTHNSATLFFIMFIIIFFIKFISNFFKTNNYLSIYYILSGILIFFIYLILLKLIIKPSEESRIIMGDYRYPFLFINLVYILIFSYKFKFLKNNNFILFLYFFSFFSPTIFFLGMNWEYERISMMMTIPYILSSSILLKKNSSYFSLFFLFSTLLSLTFLNGMYSIGLK